MNEYEVMNNDLLSPQGLQELFSILGTMWRGEETGEFEALQIPKLILSKNDFLARWNFKGLSFLGLAKGKLPLMAMWFLTWWSTDSFKFIGEVIFRNWPIK